MAILLLIVLISSRTALAIGVFIAIIAFLAYIKKISFVMIISPFVVLSFLPSQYVSLFRFNSPLGELRPDIIILAVSLLYFILTGINKINRSVFKEYKGIISALSVYFVVNILSNIFNGFTFDGFRYSLFIIIFGLGFPIIASFGFRKINPEKVIKSLIIVSTLVCIIGLLEFFEVSQMYQNLYLLDNPGFGSGNAIPRIASSLGNPLVLSAYLLLMLPCILYIREIADKKLFWNLSFLLHFLSILLTQSRSGTLIAIAALFYYFSKSIKKTIKYIIIIVVIGSIFYLLLDGLGYGQMLIDRLLFKTNSESVTIRGDAFGITSNILKQGNNLLLGIGPNEVNSYLQRNSYFKIETLDNVFLMSLTSLGLIGFISFIWIFVKTFFVFKKMDKNLRKIGYTLLFILIGMGFSFNVLYYTSVWGVFWLITSMLILWNRNLEKEKSSLNIVQ